VLVFFTVDSGLEFDESDLQQELAKILNVHSSDITVTEIVKGIDGQISAIVVLTSSDAAKLYCLFELEPD
jgi:hypothetical protein